MYYWLSYIISLRSDCIIVPGVFEDFDEFDAPAGVDDGTEVVATEYWGQNHIHHIESVQLLMQQNSLRYMYILAVWRWCKWS